jgi:L-fucose mutarotase/ribose pyranase (RbsD/FucU family)
MEVTHWLSYLNSVGHGDELMIVCDEFNDEREMHSAKDL